MICPTDIQLTEAEHPHRAGHVQREQLLPAASHQPAEGVGQAWPARLLRLQPEEAEDIPPEAKAVYSSKLPTILAVGLAFFSDFWGLNEKILFLDSGFNLCQ